MSEVATVRADEHEQKAAERAHLTGKAEKIFGKKSVEKFAELQEHPAIQDIDELSASGILTNDELWEYIVQLPEHSDLQQQIFMAVCAFIKTLQPKIPYHLEHSINPDGSWKINARIYDVINFIRSFSIAHFTEEPSYHNRVINDFTQLLYALYFYELRAQSKNNAEYTTLDSMLGMLQQDPTDYNLACGVRHALYAIHAAKIPELPKYTELLHHLQQHHPLDQLADYNQLMGEEISALGSFRKIDGWSVQIANVAVLMFAAEEQGTTAIINAKRGSNLAIGRIKILQPQRIWYHAMGHADFPDQLMDSGIEAPVQLHYIKPPTLKEQVDQDGNVDTVVENMNFDPHAIDFSVQKFTGEITLNGSGLPLSYVLAKQDYELIRCIILNHLYERLRTKEPDMEELLIGTGEPSTDGSPSEAAAELIKYCDYVREHAVPEADAAQANTTNTNTAEEVVGRNIERMYRVLSNAGGTKILAAVKRILGEPVRISGSHYIFKSLVHPGQSCPIPIHGSDPVSPGVLKKFLQKIGLSPLELHKEL